MASKFLCVFLFSIYLSAAGAATVLQINTTQLANESELVFEAEVVASRAEHIPGGNIYTYVDFLVTDLLVGTGVEGAIVRLRFTGGRVGDLKLDIGSVIPVPGERGIYFVEARDAGLANPLLGWSQGHFTIRADGAVVAANNRVVRGLRKSQNNHPALSDGVASGVITTAPAQPGASAARQEPLALQAFKQLIKDFRL